MTAQAQSSDVIDPSTSIEVNRDSIQQKESPDITSFSTNEKKADPRFEKIEVTGSYIRRIDAEGPTPVVTWDKEDFNSAGVSTVNDYMRESNLFEGSSDSGNRDGYFRFRGQHAGSTLVLVNGLRLPKLGGPDRGFYTGVEAIPTNIIERVEVLKDGSSALYGSDAMAGVMNFITKKDYDGADYSTRVTVPEINQGLQQEHNLAFGKNYSRGNWFLSTQYVEQRGVTQADIGNFYRTETLAPTSTGDIKTFNNGQSTRLSLKPSCANDPSGARCDVDFRGQDFIREPRENIGTLLSGRYDLNSNVSVSMLGIYNRRTRTEMGRPNFVTISEREGDALLNVSEMGSAELKQKLNNAQTAELALMPFNEVGSREIQVLQNSYSAQSKVEGYFLDTWKWDLSGSYAYSLEERDHRNGLVNKDTVRQNFSNGYNPLDTSNNSGAFDNARVQGVEAYEASLATARLVATGELFEMSDLWSTGGPVSIALGVENQWETTNDAHDEILINTNLNQNFEPNQMGSRQVNSIFTEMVAYPLQNLEIQAAGRYDGYSDFGGTFNPKFSMGYRPSEKILMRSSWGTNFNAPSVRNMIQRDMISYEDIQFCDPQSPNCQATTLPVTRYGFRGLQPETGVNYNFGTVIQPHKRWTFTFDQWNFEGERILGKLSGDAYNALYQSIGKQGLEDVGVSFDQNADGTISNVRIPDVVNYGNRTIRGIDIGAHFKSPVKIFGRVLNASAGFDHTHILVLRTKNSAISPDYFREDLDWKNTLTFGASTQRHNYRLAARSIAGYSRAYTTSTHTEYDFNYGYKIPFWDARLQLGVKNLLNTDTPVDLSRNFVRFDSGIQSYAFLPLGRRYYVGYSHSF